MGATNRPQDLDSAILRRMPTRFHINQPVRDFQNKSLRSLKSRGRADGVFVPAEREAARADPRADPGEREGERTSHVTCHHSAALYDSPSSFTRLMDVSTGNERKGKEQTHKTSLAKGRHVGERKQGNDGRKEDGVVGNGLEMGKDTKGWNKEGRNKGKEEREKRIKIEGRLARRGRRKEKKPMGRRAGRRTRARSDRSVFSSQVDSSISLSDIAKETEGFSGSDLREMCRDAALLCVRDFVHAENDRWASRCFC